MVKKTKNKQRKGVSLFQIIIIMILSIIVGGLLVVHIGDDKVKNLITDYSVSDEISESEKEIIEKCDNKDIFRTAECLNGEVNKFYNYKPTDDSESLTFEELKEEGGDCKDWAELYKRLGDELGFYTKFHSIQITGDIGHAYTTISNPDGWCIMTNNNHKCYGFVNE